MKGMNNPTAPTDTLSNKIELSLTRGAYQIEVRAKRSSIKVPKKMPKIGPNGPDWRLGYDEVKIRIPVTSIIVTLLHPAGDTVCYRFSKTGNREAVTVLKTGQPLTMGRSKLATGPEMVPAAGSGKPLSTNVNRAAAEIDRMSKMGWREARRLFNIDLLEAGVVGQEGKTLESIEAEAGAEA